jgi:hypothetical protein
VQLLRTETGAGPLLRRYSTVHIQRSNRITVNFYGDVGVRELPREGASSSVALARHAMPVSLNASCSRLIASTSFVSSLSCLN